METTKRFTYRQLPNGEQVRVPIDETNLFETDAMLEAQERMRGQTPSRTGIAGANQCRHCGFSAASAAILQEHERNMHLMADGGEDMRPVLLPDGTTVPAAAIPDIIAKMQQRVAEATESQAETERIADELVKDLQRKVDELEHGEQQTDAASG